MTKSRKPFEHFSQPLITREQFFSRLARHGGFAIAFIAFSLGLGMAGYRALCGMAWLDAFLNACMILTGMGPVSPMTTAAAKVFAGLYALYSGIAFLTAVGIFFAPIVHRAFHRFHLGK